MLPRQKLRKSQGFDNLKCVTDVNPSLFLQIFSEWQEKEGNEFSKFQFMSHLLEEFWNDKIFLIKLLSILDPLQRKDSVYYEVSTFKEESFRYAMTKKFITYQFENFEDENFLKEWFRNFDIHSKQNLILKLLQKVSSRHLFCLTRMIRWKLFELGECCFGGEESDRKMVIPVKLIHKSRKLNHKAAVLNHPRNLKFSSPSKYFSNFPLFLPLSITKKIFHHLDHTSIANCVKVSRAWKYLAEEVIEEKKVKSVMIKDGGVANDSSDVNHGKESEQSCLHKPYNMISVLNVTDPKRVIDFSEDVVAFVSSNKNMLTLVREPFEFEAERNLDDDSNNEIDISMPLGHVGTVKCLLLFCSKGFLITCSYDATIRKWSLANGKCLKIYKGHGDVVCCMSCHGDVLVSGSYDKNCKVWSVESGKCNQTFVHDSILTDVTIHNVDLCITATSSGLLRVFNISSGDLLKKFHSHNAPITCLKSSRSYIATSSMDRHVKVWTFQSQQSKHSLVASLEHPKAVHCIDIRNRELIAGCNDGRIRIWSLPGGACTRVLWGNRYGDPILHLVMASNRLLINTISSILIYEFESNSKKKPRRHDSIFVKDLKTPQNVLARKKEISRPKKMLSAPLPSSSSPSSNIISTKTSLSAPILRMDHKKV